MYITLATLWNLFRKGKSALKHPRAFRRGLSFHKRSCSSGNWHDQNCPSERQEPERENKTKCGWTVPIPRIMSQQYVQYLSFKREHFKQTSRTAYGHICFLYLGRHNQKRHRKTCPTVLFCKPYSAPLLRRWLLLCPKKVTNKQLSRKPQFRRARRSVSHGIRK